MNARDRLIVSRTCVAALSGSFLLLLGACGSDNVPAYLRPTPAPATTPTPSPTGQPTPSPSPTPGASANPSPTPTPTPGGSVFGRVVGASGPGFTDGAFDIAQFNNPVNVDVALDGKVYVADYDNSAIRVVASDGSVSTLLAPDDVAPLTFDKPFGLSLSGDGALYVQTDGNDQGVRDTSTGTVWRIDLVTGAAAVVARNLGRPRGLQVLGDGRIAMSDPAHHVISILDPQTGTETVIAGTEDQPGDADSGVLPVVDPPTSFNTPYGLALLADGSLLVADKGNHRLRQVALDGTVTTFAGSSMGSQNGAIASATFNGPQDVAVAGPDIYVSDHDNYLIRRISGGTVFTQAGGAGMRGYVDAEGTDARFSGLEGIAVSADGATLWIADGDNGDEEGEPGFDPVQNANFHHVRRLAVP